MTFIVQQTEVYQKWFAGIRDQQTQSRILIRVRRLALGHFGDAKQIGGGVSELRLSFGPGYRIYYAREGGEIVVLLAGGDKSSQDRDIKQAKQLARDLKGP